MRRLRPLFVLLALAALPGCVVNDGPGPVYGYAQPRSHFAPAPTYYAPAPGYYAPAPRYYAPAPRYAPPARWHNPPPSHWERNSNWRDDRRVDRREDRSDNRREERRQPPPRSDRPDQQRQFFMFEPRR